MTSKAVARKRETGRIVLLAPVLGLTYLIGVRGVFGHGELYKLFNALTPVGLAVDLIWLGAWLLVIEIILRTFIRR
jgi:hypothetical protein